MLLGYPKGRVCRQMLKAPYTGSASAVADVMIVVMPHLGILDSWLPILDELKRRETRISLSAVAPDPKLSGAIATGGFFVGSLQRPHRLRAVQEVWRALGPF